MQAISSASSLAQNPINAVREIAQRIRTLILENYLNIEAMQKLEGVAFHPSAKLDSREVDRCELYQTLIMGLAWKQLSAAGHIALKQTFVHATQALKEAISDLKDNEKLALFVDLDDGTVESTPYFAGLTGTNNEMTQERSSAWWKAQAKRSYALCGAEAFLKEAAATGKVKICYLTSRSDPSLQSDTITMLKAFGFPDVSEDSVKIAHKGKSKAEHIAEVRADCQKAMFIGDKLGDSGIKASVSTEQLRSTIREETRSRWGNDCFVVTNPVYGPSWEGITHAPFKTTAPEEFDKRQQTLQIWDDPELPEKTPPAPLTQQMQQALLYMQSPSYDALTLQTCNRAGAEFEKRVKGQDTSKMVAVMDIDGTAVNNSRWMAGLCAKGQMSNQRSLHRYVLSGDASAIEGVKELVQHYRDHNIPVVWVTNRGPDLDAKVSDNQVREATRKQLEQHGLFREGDEILMKGDCQDYTPKGETERSKRGRFDAIRHGQVIPGRNNIVQYVGDDPADLEMDAEPYHDIHCDHWPSQEASEIGSRRILMPNPIFYRGWHKALVKHWAKQDSRPELTTDVAKAARTELELMRWRTHTEVAEDNMKVLSQLERHLITTKDH